MTTVREEVPGDIAAISTINCAAFETEAEAKLVEALREQNQILVSLVAEVEGDIVGHIAFSEVCIKGRFDDFIAAGLAPMAVHPGFQKQGIGKCLIEKGLELLLEKGFKVVVVLGHPEYYPRFGFIPSSRFNIDCEYEVPLEAFMIKELETGALECVTGKVYYSELFRQL